MKNKLFLLGGLLMASSVGSFAADMQKVQGFNPDAEQIIQQGKELKTGVLGAGFLALKTYGMYRLSKDLWSMPFNIDNALQQQGADLSFSNRICAAVLALGALHLMFGIEYWIYDSIKQVDTYFDEDVHYYKSGKKWWHQRKWEEFKKDLEGLGNQFA